ncbi:hypothetical protein [Streptomyces sp. NPDC048057]|uniref:hypothetical protein n=1 Tax=Streptomyces sp. NPDC048057 TaxID=3155628 RepID=UPI0034065D60
MKPTPGYWCECWTTTNGDGKSALLASIDADTAEQAIRWIAIALHTVEPALDVDASAKAWRWFYEDRHTMAEDLLHLEPVALSITSTKTNITWTARPVSFLPLAHRQNTQLPPCTQQFRPPSP